MIKDFLKTKEMLDIYTILIIISNGFIFQYLFEQTLIVFLVGLNLTCISTALYMILYFKKRNTLNTIREWYRD